MTAVRRTRKRHVREHRCLVVEDSLFDRERLRRVLDHSFKEMQTVFAATLQEARTAVQKTPPSLILLDNNLPDGQGANFAVELSQDARYSDIAVVIVSDWPSPFMFHKAEIAGVRHVVSKSEFGARYVHSALQS